MRISIHPILLSAFIAMLPAGNAIAEPSQRTGAWQITLVPTYTNATTIDFEGGSSAALNARAGFEFGVGYNFSEHVELEMGLGGGGAGYTGTRVEEGTGNATKFAANYYMSHLNFGLTYNLLAARFTPYVTGNLGWTYVDSGIPTGNVGSICWWDPWWGYVCSPYAQTYTDSPLHYGYDIGLRYDVSRGMYLKASAGQKYIDLANAGAEPFTTYKLTLGFMF